MIFLCFILFNKSISLFNPYKSSFSKSPVKLIFLTAYILPVLFSYATYTCPNDPAPIISPSVKLGFYVEKLNYENVEELLANLFELLESIALF